MTHATTVGMTGHFEHAWTWAWRCDCGERGILLTTEESARAEADAHAGERQRNLAWAEARRDHIKGDSGACRVCGTAYPCLVIQYVQPADGGAE